MRRTIGSLMISVVGLVATACGQAGVDQASGDALQAPVVYLEETPTMRYTFEQAAKGKWLVPSYVIVGEVVEVADPRWNTTSGLRWEDDPGKVIPARSGTQSGLNPYPMYAQDVTVEVIEQIGGPSYYDDPTFPGPEKVGGPPLPDGALVLTLVLGLDQGAESSPRVIPQEAVGQRGLFVVVLMEVLAKDGTSRNAFVAADQASYLEVAPGVAIPLRAFHDERSLAERMVEAVRLTSVVDSTHDLVSFEELQKRAANPNIPLEQHLGYADIRPPSTTTTIATGP